MNYFQVGDQVLYGGRIGKVICIDGRNVGVKFDENSSLFIDVTTLWSDQVPWIRQFPNNHLETLHGRRLGYPIEWTR
jgi:hypothetical protein